VGCSHCLSRQGGNAKTLTVGQVDEVAPTSFRIYTIEHKNIISLVGSRGTLKKNHLE